MLKQKIEEQETMSDLLYNMERGSHDSTRPSNRTKASPGDVDASCRRKWDDDHRGPSLFLEGTALSGPR